MAVAYVRLREWVGAWLRDCRGQGMVEYALILALIAVLVIVVLRMTGQQVNNVFSNVSNALDGR